jgi:uncharacterized protein involved in exopolysaccharide biosynthesis
MNEIQNQHISEDEIDLIELLKKVYLEKKFILKTSILAALFGIVYALFQPNEFTSTTTFIPQLSSGVKTGGSSLVGLHLLQELIWEAWKVLLNSLRLCIHKL